MQRKNAADALGWSLNRLRSYELGTTGPAIGDVVALASLYSVDAIALAFGSAGRTADGDTRSVSHVDGPALAVPARILEGVAGPLEAVDIETPAPAVAVYQRRAMPPAAGGYAVLGGDRGALVVWLWRASGRWWMQPTPLAARQPVHPDKVLGRLVAQLARVV